MNATNISDGAMKALHCKKCGMTTEHEIFSFVEVRVSKCQVCETKVFTN